MHRIRNVLSTIALLAALAVPAAAWSEPISGSGIVEGKDVGAATLKIDGTIYRVDSTASFRWKEGDALSLVSLPVEDLTRPGGLWPLLRAEYHGDKTSAGAVLDRIVVDYASE